MVPISPTIIVYSIAFLKLWWNRLSNRLNFQKDSPKTIKEVIIVKKICLTLTIVFFTAIFTLLVAGLSDVRAGIIYSPGCSQIEGVDATTLVGGTCTAGVCDTGTGNCNDGVTTGCLSDADCPSFCSNDASSCSQDTDCGSSFCGIIGTPGVSGENKNGKPVDNMDTDDFTDSLEMCINDALIGYCTTKLGDDTGVIDLFNEQLLPPNNNKSGFCISFNDTSGCDITECSDHVDNEFCDKAAGLCDDGATACTQDSPDCDLIGTGLCNGVCSDDGSACTADAQCTDGLVDFPADPECSDYDDDNESG